MEVGAWDVQGLSLLAKPAPRPTTAIWLVNPRIPAMSPSTSMEQGTCHTDLSVEQLPGNAVLSAWR